jgi:hypothetical protein
MSVRYSPELRERAKKDGLALISIDVNRKITKGVSCNLQMAVSQEKAAQIFSLALKLLKEEQESE